MEVVKRLHMTSLCALSCAQCGVRFALDADHEQALRKSGETFYCPRGHSLTYGDNELTRTKRLLEQQTKRTEWMQKEAEIQRIGRIREERRVRSVKGHATRLRKRIAQGKCPCCSKQFKDIEAHISEEHPRYGRDDEQESAEKGEVKR